jgi:hypothetical protein
MMPDACFMEGILDHVPLGHFVSEPFSKVYERIIGIANIRLSRFPTYKTDVAPCYFGDGGLGNKDNNTKVSHGCRALLAH